MIGRMTKFTFKHKNSLFCPETAKTNLQKKVFRNEIIIFGPDKVLTSENWNFLPELLCVGFFSDTFFPDFLTKIRITQPVESVF